MAYIITVSNPGSGNRYYVDSVLQQQLSFQEGSTHRFDQSDSSNSGHPLRLSATANGTHGGGSEYTTGVTTSGTPGQAGAYTEITVAYGAPTLYYYCTAHSGMGGQVNIVVLKNFELNGPVVVGKDTKVTVGTVTSGAVDLSTGNYFVDSPSGDYTYSFTNPGAVQAFQIEATGGSAAVASTFSTTLYTGNATSQTITNGLDLSTDGGLVWIKRRDGSASHALMDTERGVQRLLSSDTSDVQALTSCVPAFNTDGFDLGSSGLVNEGSWTYASWTFKKKTKFFDIVTWTGTGGSRAINHSLGSVPGMIIVKWYDGAGENWTVYHRSLNGGTDPEDYGLKLNTTAAEANESGYWNDTAPTSTQFTVGGNLNSSYGGGGEYIAYIFAHDTASDGLIQCGSYTGTGADNPVTLGWSPQWLMVKRSNAAASWEIMDTTRGMVSGQLVMLEANSNAAEVNAATANSVGTTSTGFTVGGAGNSSNASGSTYIYMAIRSASAPAITWPTSIEWTQGTTPKTPAEGATDVYTFTTDDGGTTYTGIQSIDTAS